MLFGQFFVEPFIDLLTDLFLDFGRHFADNLLFDLELDLISHVFLNSSPDSISNLFLNFGFHLGPGFAGDRFFQDSFIDRHFFPDSEEVPDDESAFKRRDTRIDAKREVAEAPDEQDAMEEFDVELGLSALEASIQGA